MIGQRALVLAACVGCLAGCCGAKKPPCDQAKLASVVAECTAESQICVSKGQSQAECSTLADCDSRIEKACAK